MNVDTIWNRLTRLIVVLLVIVILLLVGIWYLPLIRQNENMRKEELRLDGEIKKEDEKARGRRASIESVRGDPKTVERLAREKLGLAKPGETVIHFQEGPVPILTNTNAAPNLLPAARP